MSKAAWGEVQKGGSQYVIRNYEVGVLFLPPPQQIPISTSSSTPSKEPITPKPPFLLGVSPKVTADQVTFPIPYQFPPSKYSPSDKPWTWGTE